MADAFGKALLDYYKKRKVQIIIERDDGYKEKHSIEPYFYKYARWPLAEKKALKYAFGKILDIGCGAGRHCLYFQNKGFEITGIDISSGALKVCKMRGVKDVRKMSLFNLKFKPRTFDTVLMMYNNFGLAGNIERTKKVLRDLYKITSAKGRIIASSTDPAITKNPAHLKYHELNRKKGRPIGQVRIRNVYKNIKGSWFGLLMVNPKEMAEAIWYIFGKSPSIEHLLPVYLIGATTKNHGSIKYIRAKLREIDGRLKEHQKRIGKLEK